MKSLESGGCFLRTHPRNDTESNLVDHVSNVVCNTHHQLAFSAEIDDYNFWTEQVTDWVDNPTNDDKPSKGVCRPQEFRSDFVVVDTFAA